MPNRSKRDEKQSAGRPKVGPADPETRRRKLAEHIAKGREESRAGLYQSKRKTAAAPRENPTKDLSAMTAAKRLRDRRHQIEDAIDEAAGARKKRT